MDQNPDIFISSLTRRQLARRRSSRRSLRVQLPLGLIVIVAAAVALIAARGGV